MSSVEVTAEALGLELLAVTAPEQRQAIDALLRGLPTEGWKHVTDALGVSDQQLTEVVGLSISTLTRRRREGSFTPEESERLLRVAGLAAKAESVFTSPERVRAWFATPNHQLTGHTPLSYSRTSIGAAEVHRVLERILDGAPA